MSLFGSLYIGDSGLRTSQNALNTVAHNLSNVNTPGYVRQQVHNADRGYGELGRNAASKPMYTGTGAFYAECRHVRDALLDERYRDEVGRQAYYDKSYEVMQQIENTMGELDAAAFKGSLQGLWTAMQQLSTSPNDVTNISLLVSKASQFAENATAVYASFTEYQDNLNRQIIEAVNRINEIGQQIHMYNKKIIEIEAGDVENANDIRDKRDLLIDELAQYGNISTREAGMGVLTVQFNYNDFVVQGQTFEMAMLTDKDTGYVTPYWKQNLIYTQDEKGNRIPDYESARVFDVTEDISMKRNTDMGSLRAMLIARGDHAATYADLEVGMMSQRKLDALGITELQYNESQGLKYYDKVISNSCIMNIEAEFDNIVHKVVTLVNQTLFDAASRNPVSGYLLNEDGSPMQMFLKNETPGYEKVTLREEEAKALEEQGAKLIRTYDEKGNPLAIYWRYMEENPDSEYSLYSCTNIRINEKLVQMPSLLGFKEEDESVDYNIGAALVKTFNDNTIKLNPNAVSPSRFEDCYIDLMSQVTNTGFIFNELSNIQKLEVESTENDRQTVIGVSTDEELEHMIMYQQAYNASSRYINVIAAMIETIIGLAG